MEILSLIATLLLKILEISGLLAGIAIIVLIIYTLYWVGYFTPLFRSVKLEDEKRKHNIEIQKIESKKDYILDETAFARQEFAKTTIDIERAEQNLIRKQKLLKQYELELVEFKKWQEQGSPKVAPEEVSKELEEKEEILDLLDEKVQEKIEAKEVAKKQPKKQQKKQ